jgi:SAF domain
MASAQPDQPTTSPPASGGEVDPTRPPGDQGTGLDPTVTVEPVRSPGPGQPAPALAGPPRRLTIDAGQPLPEPSARTLDPRRLRAGPLSRFLLVIAVLAVAGAIFATTRNPEQVPVLIATRDIPAYHVITSDDVKLGTRAAAPKSGYAALPVEGRLTLAAITKDQPLRQSQIAPDIASVFPGALSVYGFAVPRATVLDGALRAGDRIQLLLVRDGRRLPLVGKDGAILDRLEAIVLSVIRSGETATLVVAFRADEAKTNEIAIGTGTVVVFKDPSAPNATG